MKFLASKPQVLKNCPVLGSRTALFFKWLKFCRSAKNVFLDRFFGDRQKKFFEDLFLENTSVCVLGPWPRAFLSLASDFFCVLGLGRKLVSSTPPLSIATYGTLLRSFAQHNLPVTYRSELQHDN